MLMLDLIFIVGLFIGWKARGMKDNWNWRWKWPFLYNKEKNHG